MIRLIVRILVFLFRPLWRAIRKRLMTLLVSLGLSSIMISVAAAWLLGLRSAMEDVIRGHSTQPDFLGRMPFMSYTELDEFAQDLGPSVPIPAGQCLNIGQALVPQATPGELTTYWQSTIFNADAIDASTNCDGGSCSAWVTTKLPSDFHGGQMCTMGGAVCAGADGGGIDTTYDQSIPAVGPAAGVTAHLVWNATAGQIQLKACCGPGSGCRAAGRISSIREFEPAIIIGDAGPVDASDSGSDSGSDAGADSGGDAGFAISSLVPPGFDGGGSWPFVAAGGGDIRSWDLSPSTTITAVYVDNAVATGLSQVGSVVTATIPASSVDAVQGNAQDSVVTMYSATGHAATAPGHEALYTSTTGSLFYIPNYRGTLTLPDGGTRTGVAYDAWNAQGSNSATSAIYDESGNAYVLAPFNGGPNYFLSGGGMGGNLPRFNSNSAANVASFTSTFPTVTGAAWFFGGQKIGAISNTALWCAFTSGTAANLSVSELVATPTVASQYNGSAPTNTVPMDGGVFDLWSLFTIPGTGSEQVLNGGAPSSGGNPGTTAGSGGFLIAGPHMAGDLYWIVYYPDGYVTATGIGNGAAAAQWLEGAH